MKRFARVASSAVLVAAGVALGVAWVAPPAGLSAQDAPQGAVTVDISEADAEKVKQASDALATAQAALEQSGAYRPAVSGQNPYAVLAGGLDAMADLDGPRGVDPITYTGLHAGLAIDEVSPQLAYDAMGRLTYKGRLVRMYPPEKMKEMIERQKGVLAVTSGTSKTAPAGGAE